MKYLFAFAVFILLSVSLCAQVQYDWHHASNDTNQNMISSMQYGDQNELYIVGSGWQLIDLDYTATTIMSPEPNYVAVYSHTGSYLRSWGLAGAGIAGLCIADNGDVILYGTFSGNIDFNPLSTPSMVNGGWYSTFVARYTKFGQLIWVRSWESPNNATAVVRTVKEAGNMLTVGMHIEHNNVLDTLDLDPGPGWVPDIDSNSLTSGVIRLTSSGNYVWSFCIPETRFSDLSMNTTGEVAFTGVTRYNVDFDPDTGVAQHITSTTWGIGDWFVAQYDPWGGYVWHFATAFCNNGYLTSVHINNGGEIFVKGEAPAGFDIDPGNGVVAFPNAINNFYAKYFNGSLLWAINNCVAFTVNDVVGTSYVFDSTGLNCYSPSGTIMWNVPMLPNVGCGIIALSQNDKICLAGAHYAADDFDPGPATLIVSANAQHYKLSLDDPLASVSETTAGSQLSLYPNPATEVITLSQSGDAINEFTIINSLGQVVISGTTTGRTTQIPVSSLAPGLYYLRMEGEITARSFVVQ